MKNVVVAVNDKVIEKYLSTQLPAVNVLCTLKRREQVIDAVINRNPHMVVLSSVLGGKMDMREIVTTLRQVKPQLTIGFIYGERDDECRAFIDFLVRHQVYNFILGEITADNLSALVLQETPYEAVKLYLLDNTLIETPEAVSPPAIPPEPEHRTLNVQIVEKIKYVGNITVSIGSLFPRTGCTHTALEMGKHFRAEKKDVAVCTDIAALTALRKYYMLNDDEHNIKGCMVYDDVSLARQKHRVIITDCGHSWQSENPGNFYNHNLSILICPSAPWEIDRLTDFLRNNPHAQDIRYLFYPVDDRNFTDIRRNMEQGGCKAYKLAYSPNWLASVNGKAYSEIFKSLLDQV